MKREENAEDHKVIGRGFLVFAIVLSLCALAMRGVESLRAARLTLIVISIIFIVLGLFICFQKGGKENARIGDEAVLMSGKRIMRKRILEIMETTTKIQTMKEEN
jgi:amino acid transporter